MTHFLANLTARLEFHNLHGRKRIRAFVGAMLGCPTTEWRPGSFIGSETTLLDTFSFPKAYPLELVAWFAEGTDLINGFGMLLGPFNVKY